MLLVLIFVLLPLLHSLRQLAANYLLNNAQDILNSRFGD